MRPEQDPRRSPDVKVFVSCRWGWRASSRSTSVWRSIRSARTRSGWPSAAFTALCRSAVPSPASRSEAKHFLSVEKMERVAASESQGSDVCSPQPDPTQTWPPHPLLLARTLTCCHSIFRRSQQQSKNGLEHHGPQIITAPDWFGECLSVDLNIGSSPRLYSGGSTSIWDCSVLCLNSGRKWRHGGHVCLEAVKPAHQHRAQL